MIQLSLIIFIFTPLYTLDQYLLQSYATITTVLGRIIDVLPSFMCPYIPCNKLVT